MTKHIVQARSGLLNGTAYFGPILADARDALLALEERRTELFDASQVLIAAADEAETDLSEEDLTTIENNTAEIEKLDKQINARKAMTPQGAGRRSTPEPQNRNEPGGNRKVPANARVNPGTGGFKNLGEFAQCVRAAGSESPDQGASQKLQNALTTYGNEGTGADGGNIVPPDFRRDIAVKIMGEESLIARTDRMVTSSNNIVLPKDETSPYGTTGIQAYWESEAGQKTQSKPIFGQNSLRLNKLIALVPVTDELLEDAPAIDSYLRNKTPQVMTAKLNTAIIRGTGAGQPLGLLSGSGLITVAKDSSQVADTITFDNIVNMYSRMYAPSVNRAVWLVNQSIMPALFKMRFLVSATSPVPAYLPPNGLADAPYGTLMGRPIIPVEAMSTLGDLGDIVFADLSQYLTVTKGQDIKTDVSIHLFFDYDVTAFRFVFRVAGQPWWNSAITPQAAGAPTLGHIVTLAERS